MVELEERGRRRAMHRRGKRGRPVHPPRMRFEFTKRRPDPRWFFLFYTDPNYRGQVPFSHLHKYNRRFKIRRDKVNGLQIWVKRLKGDPDRPKGFWAGKSRRPKAIPPPVLPMSVILHKVAGSMIENEL